MSSAEKKLRALWRDVADLDATMEILGWDQETYMPPRGVQGRARALATLAGLRHGLLASDAMQAALADCDREAGPGSELAAQVRVARQKVDRAVKVPGDLARAQAEARSAGLAVWQEARRKKDFSLFRVALERIVALKREEAQALADGGPLYDALLDEFEPGATEAALAPLFESLVQALAPLVQAVAASGLQVDEAPARGVFPAEKQRAFGRMVAESMGFDFTAGRLDATAHPFCSGFNPGDVRITWRWQEDDFRPALFGIMHEAGHGLYEQGLPAAWTGTPIGQAVSLGVHESQSRLWENLVGRSRAFWKWALPRFQQSFPGKRGLSVDALWPALHTVKPSFVRVEADEATYNLHIAIRFEVERGLFRGDYAVPDLPQVWNDAYERLLGIRPPDDALGVLQDIHWGMGAFGYFPTYTLGNLINSQLYETAREALGGMEEQFAGGDFRPLLEWLRAQVHSQGSRWSAEELVERVTGRPLGTAAFIRYLTATTEEAYGLSLPAA